MFRPSIGLVVWLALGCKPAVIDAEPPDRGSILEGNATAGVALGPTTLAGGESLMAWNVNTWGVAVQGGDLSLTIDGGAVTVPTDPSGMGEWIPTGPGAYEVDAGDGAVTVVAHEGAWPAGNLDEAYALPREVVGTASVGGAAVVVLDGGALYTVDPATGPWPVAQVSGTLRAVKAVALDDDGQRDDLLVVTDTLLLLATGSEDGRFLWRGGLQAEGSAFRGADVGDIDDDGAAELVLAVGEAVDWWDLDGGSLAWWGRADLDRPLEDVGVTVTPGPDIITVLDDVGWVRLQYAEGDLLDVGPDAPASLETARLLARGADMDGDGTEEIVLYPRAGRDPRGQVFVGSLGEGGQQSTTERTYEESGVTLVDVDGDGGEDIVSVSGGGTVKRLGFLLSGPREWTLGRVPSGPVAVSGATGGALGRLVVAQAGLARVYRAGSNETSPWRPKDRPRTVYKTLVPERLLTWDDGVDFTGSFAAVVTRDGSTFFGTYVWEDITDPLNQVTREGATVLEPDEALIDAVVCEDEALLLTDDRLIRVGLAPDSQSTLAEVADVPGTAVACAKDGDTFHGVVLSSGQLTPFDGDLVAGTPVGATGAVGVAMSVDTLGAPVFETCTTAGCRILSVGSVGGDAAYVSWGGESLSITTGDGAALAGLEDDIEGVTVHDVDGDGDDDVVATVSSGLVWVLRRAGASFDTEVRHRHAFTSWTGPVASSDVDGDGSAEVIGLSEEGSLFLWITRGD